MFMKTSQMKRQKLFDLAGKRVSCTATMERRGNARDGISIGVQSEKSAYRYLLVNLDVEGNAIDHVWIDCPEMCQIKTGTRISFDATVHHYQRLDARAMSFGLINPCNIHGIGRDQKKEKPGERPKKIISKGVVVNPKKSGK